MAKFKTHNGRYSLSSQWLYQHELGYDISVQAKPKEKIAKDTTHNVIASVNIVRITGCADAPGDGDQPRGK